MSLEKRKKKTMKENLKDIGKTMISICTWAVVLLLAAAILAMLF